MVVGDRRPWGRCKGTPKYVKHLTILPAAFDGGKGATVRMVTKPGGTCPRGGVALAPGGGGTCPGALVQGRLSGHLAMQLLV